MELKKYQPLKSLGRRKAMKAPKELIRQRDERAQKMKRRTLSDVTIKLSQAHNQIVGNKIYIFRCVCLHEGLWELERKQSKAYGSFINCQKCNYLTWRML
jgi:hypothetical protein